MCVRYTLKTTTVKSGVTREIQAIGEQKVIRTESGMKLVSKSTNLGSKQ